MNVFKNEGVKIIGILTLMMLILVNCGVTKAHGAVVPMRSVVSMPLAVKAQTKANSTPMSKAKMPLVVTQMIPTVCIEKGKTKNRCVRK